MIFPQKNKKVLMISSDPKLFENGSAVRKRMAKYAEGWDEMYIIDFCKSNMARNGSNEISRNCFVYPTNSKIKIMYIFDALNIAGKLIKKDFCWVLCQDPFFTGVVGLFLKKRFSVPLEVSVHTDIGSSHYTYNMMNLVRKWMGIYIIKRADHVRVVSNRIAKFVNNLGVTLDNIEVRPIDIDVDFFQNSPILVKSDLKKKYPQFSLITLMASRIEPEKNIILAIDSWKKIIEEKVDAGLIIVGEGNIKRYLQEKVNALGLEKNVIFEPWSDRATLASYYKSTDIFLLTSFFEGYGMTLAEAKASGCKKIISTDVGIAEDVGARIIGLNKSDLIRAILE